MDGEGKGKDPDGGGDRAGAPKRAAEDNAILPGPTPSALERIRAIRGVTFEWREESLRDSRSRVAGVIAQEVEAVFPEAVSEDESGYKLVDYKGLVAVLIEAVKELADRVEALEAERLADRSRR